MFVIFILKLLMTVDKPLYDLQSVSHLVVLTDILKF